MSDLNFPASTIPVGERVKLRLTKSQRETIFLTFTGARKRFEVSGPKANGACYIVFNRTRHRMTFGGVEIAPQATTPVVFDKTKYRRVNDQEIASA